jgi:hypothetical protein
MSSVPDPTDQRRAAALAALQAGKDARGLLCPWCGGGRLRSVRNDAEENLFWAAAFLLVGFVSLVAVIVGGDTGLYVANLSTIGLTAILVGVLLLVIARHRRRPSAYECPDCHSRVP